MTNRFRKGDTVFYFAQGNPRWPVRARVDKVHRDGGYTVTALWNVDRATGQDTVDMGHLGYVYRMHGGLLMDRVGRDRRTT
jgi:hypothetical protein